MEDEEPEDHDHGDDSEETQGHDHNEHIQHPGATYETQFEWTAANDHNQNLEFV